MQPDSVLSRVENLLEKRTWAMLSATQPSISDPDMSYDEKQRNHIEFFNFIHAVNPKSD